MARMGLFDVVVCLMVAQGDDVLSNGHDQADFLVLELSVKISSAQYSTLEMRI